MKRQNDITSSANSMCSGISKAVLQIPEFDTELKFSSKQTTTLYSMILHRDIYFSSQSCIKTQNQEGHESSIQSVFLALQLHKYHFSGMKNRIPCAAPKSLNSQPLGKFFVSMGPIPIL